MGARKPTIAAALLSTLAALALAAGEGAPAGAAAAPPNIVVVMTDDQRVDDLYAKVGRKRLMPHTRRLIAWRGVTFNRAYASYPLSCPSRTTFLTGRYAHNHEITANILAGGRYCGEPGIFPADDSLGPWLQAAGYRTILMGRYLNAYPGRGNPKTNVDPGWDRWLVPVTVSPRHQAPQFFDYVLNRDGTLTRPSGFSARSYFTDALHRNAVAAIAGTPDDQPLFLYLAHRAPHEDVPLVPDGPEPAPRHRKSVNETKAPRYPNYDEGDVSDKPRYVRLQPPLTAKERKRATTRSRRRRASLRSVDDGIELLRDALAREGRLDNTYFIFTSDNGFGLGEHRFPKGKTRPYEETARVPLLIAGPGIPAGRSSRELVSNVDLAPTILELAGAQATTPPDGRSLLPFARRPRKRSTRPLVIEAYRDAPDRGQARSAGVNFRILADDYQGIVFGRYKLVRYFRGDHELYDLKRDRFELQNRFRDPAYRRVRTYLLKQLRRLDFCKGDQCRKQVRKPPNPRAGNEQSKRK